MATGGAVYSRPRPLRVPPSIVAERPPKEALLPAVTRDLEHLWTAVRDELASTVDPSTFRIWLDPLRPAAFEDDRLVLVAPRRTCEWIADRFARVLQTAAASVAGPAVIVDLVPDDAPRPRAGGARGRRAAAIHATATTEPKPRARSGPPLNPRLTFGQFVIGDGNRLAHAAALQVAEQPGQSFNPLFLYGPPGLGKTHLLHSIGHLVLEHGGGLSVLCTTGEEFTNTFVAALQDGGRDAFKERFRGVDVLLIDDIQFIERKARTEEEFFHTFNALYDAGSQLVLTSDRLPRDMDGLEARLRERFESGLMADLGAPDLATRLTILRKRAHQDGVVMAEAEALEAIAERVTDNVRALEGALIRTVAYSSLTGRALTVQLAEEVLAGLYPAPRRRATSVADIQAAACEHFGLTAEELVSPGRTQRVAWPRQVAMYLSRELTGESLPAIGRHFGGRDHTTVLHAWRRTGERIGSDPRAHRAVADLRARLHAGDL